jgi:hypothetical protein
VSPTDTEFFRAFAGRVRETVADTTPKGGPAVNATTTTETTETIPATFQAPDAPCAAHPWCVETGRHVEHVGRLVQPPTGEAQIWWEDGDERPMILFGDEQTDYADLTTGDQLRQRAGQWTAHAARLGALADEYDAICEAAAHRGDETPTTVQSATEVAREWTITTRNGVVVRGYLPPWAEGTPTGQNVRPDLLHVVLEDIMHVRRYEGAQLGVHFYSDDAARCGAEGVLIPRMTVEPHAENVADRVPTVSVEILAGLGDEIEGLDPAGVCALADKLRQHADYLDDVAAHLQDAREDWARNGGAPAACRQVLDRIEAEKLPAPERAGTASLVDTAADLVVKAVTASLAGLQTNPRDVAERLHRAIDNAQGWHLAEVGDHCEAQAYADSRLGTAITAMADAMGAAFNPRRMETALRNALDMVIEEAR